MTSKRVRLFWIVFSVLFVWEIIPECKYIEFFTVMFSNIFLQSGIFPLLTGFSIFCLADNHSPIIRNLFGGASNNEGMGLLAVCFDWNLITSSSLWSPLWLQINQYIGTVLTYVLMAAVYYGNLWRAKDFPFMSQAIFVSSQDMHKTIGRR